MKQLVRMDRRWRGSQLLLCRDFYSLGLQGPAHTYVSAAQSFQCLTMYSDPDLLCLSLMTSAQQLFVEFNA